MQRITQYFQPNKNVERSSMGILIAMQVLALLGLWFVYPNSLFPTPIGIWNSLVDLVSNRFLLQHLWSSMSLGMEAMLMTVLISLTITYLTVLPFFRPIGFVISKMRFLTLVGLSFLFVLMTDGSHELKVWLLIFGISVFFITSAISAINAIPRGEFNHARTLGMSEWEVVWHVVILGTIDQVFEIIRQNFAICWTLLTMVEGIARSEGGVGVMLLDQNKHFQLDAVFAIQLMIFTVGIGQDYILGFIKNLFCPYAKLTLERK